MHQWMISYQWKRYSAEHAVSVWQYIQNMLELEGRKDWHSIFITYISKSPQPGSKLCPWLNAFIRVHESKKYLEF